MRENWSTGIWQLANSTESAEDSMIPPRTHGPLSSLDGCALREQGKPKRARGRPPQIKWDCGQVPGLDFQELRPGLSSDRIIYTSWLTGYQWWHVTHLLRPPPLFFFSSSKHCSALKSAHVFLNLIVWRVCFNHPRDAFTVCGQHNISITVNDDWVHFWNKNVAFSAWKINKPILVIAMASKKCSRKLHKLSHYILKPINYTLSDIIKHKAMQREKERERDRKRPPMNASWTLHPTVQPRDGALF